MTLSVMDVFVFRIPTGRDQHDNNWSLPFKLTEVTFQPDDDIRGLRRSLASDLRVPAMNLIIYKVRTLVFRMCKVLNWHS